MPTKVAATRPEQRATWKKSLKGAEDPVGAKDLVRPQSLASSRSNPSQKPTHDMQPLPGVVKVQQGASKRPRLSEDTTTIVDAQQNDKRLRVEVPPEETRAGASKEPSPVSPAVSTPDSAAGGSFPSNTNATSAAGLVKRPPPPPRPAASSLFVPKKRVSLPRIMACLTLSSSDVPAVMAG